MANSNDNPTKKNDPLVYLWAVGVSMFKKKWIDGWGDAPNEIDKKILSSLSIEQINAGLAVIGSYAVERNGFPPVPVEFADIARKEHLNIPEAYARMISGKSPVGEIDRIARGMVAYQCKSLSERHSEALFTKTMLKVERDLRHGKVLTSKNRILPKCNSSKTDSIRDQFSDSDHPLVKRFKAIKNES